MLMSKISNPTNQINEALSLIGDRRDSYEKREERDG